MLYLTCNVQNKTKKRKVGLKKWSGKRDSNPRPLPWQGNALPTELFPQYENFIQYTFMISVFLTKSTLLKNFKHLLEGAYEYIFAFFKIYDRLKTKKEVLNHDCNNFRKSNP